MPIDRPFLLPILHITLLLTLFFFYLSLSFLLSLSMHHLWFSEIRDVFPLSAIVSHGKSGRRGGFIEKFETTLSSLQPRPPSSFFFHRLPPFFIRASFPFIPLFYSILSPLLGFHAFLSRHFLYPFPPPCSPLFLASSFFFSFFPSLEEEELGRSKGTGSNFHRCIRDENPFLVSLLLYFIVLDRMDRVGSAVWPVAEENRIGLNRERGWRGIVRIPSGYFTPIRVEFSLTLSFSFFLSSTGTIDTCRAGSRTIGSRFGIVIEIAVDFMYANTSRGQISRRLFPSSSVSSNLFYRGENSWMVRIRFRVWMTERYIRRIFLLFTLRYWGVW